MIISFDVPESLRYVFGVPSTKVPISSATFVSYLIPPLVCYFAAAVLAVTPQTRAFRVALWPVVTLLAFRAAFSVDLSQGKREQSFLNVEFARFMASVAANTLSWALAKRPLVRYLRPLNSSPSVIMDALDLTVNLRGIGWDWSRGLYVPRETRPTNRIAFVLYALLSLFAFGWLYIALPFAVHIFITLGSTPQDPTIFDESLPFLVRYLRSSIIAILFGFGSYISLQTTYTFVTLLGVLLFGEDPAQWPPGFDQPWCSTSLSEFWSRRWHQWYRHMFIVCASPFSVVLGRAGTVIGAFLTSGLFHYYMIFASDGQAEMWWMVVAFGMMIPAVLAERAFYQWTGKKVGGVVGWFWTFAWLLLCGNVMINGYARARLYEAAGNLDAQFPSCALVKKLVITLDGWLRTL